MKKLLICEDDKGILEMMSLVLEEAGYTVLALTNTNGIKEIIKQESPSLILLDLWMPGAITGGDLIKKLKSTKGTSAIPLIVVSASKDTQKIAIENGADNFLPKPFDIEALTDIVARYAK